MSLMFHDLDHHRRQLRPLVTLRLRILRCHLRRQRLVALRTPLGYVPHHFVDPLRRHQCLHQGRMTRLSAGRLAGRLRGRDRRRRHDPWWRRLALVEPIANLGFERQHPRFQLGDARIPLAPSRALGDIPAAKVANSPAISCASCKPFQLLGGVPIGRGPRPHTAPSHAVGKPSLTPVSVGR